VSAIGFQMSANKDSERTHRDRLSLAYWDLWSRTMMKDTIDTQWVATPTRQRLATSRKRALRRHSVRVARSVCSESQSRVIEPRKLAYRWGLPVCVRGDSITAAAMAMAVVARPGSKSVAKRYWGIPGTCEGLPLLDENDSRNGTPPSDQRPGPQVNFPWPVVANFWKASRYHFPSPRQGDWEGASGRLSRLIVALESRVTLPGRSL